jgi:uncharacterized protein
MLTSQIAREWYDANDPVHGFDHVLRVLHLAEKMGSELGADLEVIRAAAFLHDATGAEPGDGSQREQHQNSSAEFAREVLTKQGWDEERIQQVEHCIRAHRFRGSESPTTPEAQILFDADKLDVVGAFGIARTLGYALQAGQPFYAEPSKRFKESKELEGGEPHSAYHEYLFKLKEVPQRLYTEPARRIAKGRYQLLTLFFEQLAAEAHGTG